MADDGEDDDAVFELNPPEFGSLEVRRSRQQVLNRLFGEGEASPRYVLLRVLGRGGMGVVYLARDWTLERLVAIKTVRACRDPSLEKRLHEEARAMAQLSHPNLVPIYDLAYEQDQTFIVMEYIEGVTLSRWLVEEQHPRSEVLRVFAEAGEGLAAAHHRGLVHGDFKPANVMVGSNGRARVMDFGLARNDPGSDATLFRDAPSPAIVGTPRYMAPEQFRGGWVDARSDQYAFCVTLFEALYGVHPYATPDMTLAELAEAATHNERRTPANADVPKWLRRILMLGFAPDPRERFDSMAKLIVELVGGPSGPPPTNNRRTVQVTLSANFDEIEEDDLSYILDVLRVVARDRSLTIESISRGSIVLRLKTSQEGARELLSSHLKGTLDQRLGTPVLKILTRQASDPDPSPLPKGGIAAGRDLSPGQKAELLAGYYGTNTKAEARQMPNDNIANDRLSLTLKLSRDHRQWRESDQQRLVQKLRDATGDPTIAVTSTQTNSVTLTLDISREAARELLRQQNKNELDERLGVPVLLLSYEHEWDLFEALLQLWREGDQRSAERVIDLLGMPIARFFRNKVSGGAEDFVQETFTRLLQQRDAIRDGRALRMYTFRIARNVWREHLRRMDRRGEEIDFDAVSLEALSRGQTSIVARKQEHRLLLEAFRRLSIEQQFLLELRLIEGLKFDEIAEIVEVPSATLRYRMTSARKRLATIVAELEAEPGLIASTIEGIDTWAAEIRAQLGRGDDAD